MLATSKSIPNDFPKYLYFINYRIGETDICNLEMKALFGIVPRKKHFFSSLNVDPSRSVFINGSITILNIESSLEELENSVLNDNLTFEEYKIKFMKTDDHVEYQIRLEALRKIGFAIEGSFAIRDPLVSLAIAKIGDQWVFGHYTRNDNMWVTRKQKPFNYSNALDVKLAKTIMNIAIGNNFDLDVVDPCCGVGTVLIEGRLMDINIEGYDYNWSIVQNCNKNLKHFGFKDDVKKFNMLNLNKTYDVAILDLPYGQFSLTSLSEQTALIKKTKELANKTIIVTMEDMSNLITDCGFTITDQCMVTKSNTFSRYITVCK